MSKLLVKASKFLTAELESLTPTYILSAKEGQQPFDNRQHCHQDISSYATLKRLACFIALGKDHTIGAHDRYKTLAFPLAWVQV